MYKLILMLFIAALMFGCSKDDDEHAGDEANEAAEHAGDAAEDTAEHAGDKAEEAAEHAGDAAESVNGPKLEPLPDWDSLPPIEEEMAAEEGSTMMGKAEEVVEKAKEHAGDAAESAKEMMKKE